MARSWLAVARKVRPLCTCHGSGIDMLQVGEAGWQVMNEVTLHRGRHTHLTVVDAYFDGEHLTEAVVGLIFPLRLID
jgi:NAD kinase